MKRKGKPYEHKRIRCLKEAACMLGHSDLLSRPSIVLNMTWKSIIKSIIIIKKKIAKLV